MSELSPVIFIDAVKREREARRAEQSLYEFVIQAWPSMEPGVPFVPSWHIKIICEHLEAITSGEIRRLLINIPPRHSKSTIVSVAFPCWEWLRRPQEKYLCASYSGTLAMRDNVKARRLVTSPWYQERWGGLFKLSSDVNQKQRFENDKTGYRIATSVGGTATGEGGSRLILDDAISTQDAQSDAVRNSTLEWLDMAWSTRLNNPKTDAMIEVAQRCHQSDPSGHRLKQGGWEHVCIPAEYDGIVRKNNVFVEGYDPRDKVGQLICPDRFGKKELEDLKKQLGEYGTSGQLQQRPAPAGGGILKTKHFQLWPYDKELPVFDFVLQSLDAAYTANTTNDPSAFGAYGVFTHNGRRGAMLLDCWADHLTFPDLRSKLVEEWHAVYGKSSSRKGKKPDAFLIEAKASGLSMIQDLRQANIPAIPYNPGNADKVNRAHQVAPVLELDCLWIPESGKEPGKPVTWARGFLKELEVFPNGERDDQVDQLTQAIIYLRDQGWFELAYAELDEIEEYDYEADRKRKINPYAC